MADVRSLLKNERAARRIQHKYASYSTTGSLLCVVCRMQLKSESLWSGHIKSPGHVMRAQKVEDAKDAETHVPEPTDYEVGSQKKRKADDEQDGNDDLQRKRNKIEAKDTSGLPHPALELEQPRPILRSPTGEFQIPSRPATPSKPILEVPKRVDVDEDEWAAFEADIAAADVPISNGDAVISAPAMSAAELAQKSTEESNLQRKQRQEAELEGDKEDAARKMEDQLDEMESLEQRVKRLREKREEIRKKDSVIGLNRPQTTVAPVVTLEEDDEESEEDDEDEWDGFRRK